MIGSQVAGSGVQAYSAYKQGQYANAAAREEAKMLANQRDEVIRAGAQEEDLRRQDGQAATATAKAAVAANNIDTTSGVGASQIARAALGAELDAETIKANTARSAWGLEWDRKSTLAAGRNAERAGKLAAIGSILGGGAAIAGGIAANGRK